MKFKTLTNKVTNRVGRQVLVAQKHSPVMLFGAGVIGMGATVFLACRATLKLGNVLEEGEKHLSNVDPEGAKTSDEQEDLKKAAFGVKLNTAIKVVKLYLPTAVVGAVTVGAMTSSHVILKKRNAGLAMAYAIVDKSFKDYRGRVIEDQGKEKDFQYRVGTIKREVVEEGPNGPEVRIIEGPDAEALKQEEEVSYIRIFDETNPNWSEIPNSNQLTVQAAQNFANDMLRVKGKVYLNDVHDLLGLERTDVGQLVGWVYGSGEGDNDIDFGVWNGSTFDGMEWAKGNSKGIVLDFNVQGLILGGHIRQLLTKKR